MKKARIPRGAEDEHFHRAAKRAAAPPNRRGSAPFPDQPGVYIFRNSDEQTVYVGKAKSLRHRLRSYSYKTGCDDVKISHLLASARSVEIIVTNTEGEALNLENRLIKQMRPRYNVLLRDDKAYPYLKLAATGLRAEVTVTRRREVDDAIYYGPFFPASLAHQIARVIRRHSFAASRSPAVLEYVTGRPSPSVKQRSETGPRHGIRREPETLLRVRRLLEGHINATVADLSRRMMAASNAKRFEQAARYRHSISVLKQLRQHTQAADIPEGDTDIIGICREGPWTALTIFQFRSDEIASRYDLIGNSRGRSCEKLFSLSLRSLYSCSSAPPDIVRPVWGRHQETVTQTPSSVAKRGSRIRAATVGPLRAWEEIARKNAQASLVEWIRGSVRRSYPVRYSREAQYALNEAYPRRWQTVGPSGGCYRSHGSWLRTARSGSGQWRPFVAVRRSEYTRSIPSRFASPLLLHHTIPRKGSSPRTNDDTTLSPESAEPSRVSINPPGSGAMVEDRTSIL